MIAIKQLLMFNSNFNYRYNDGGYLYNSTFKKSWRQF